MPNPGRTLYKTTIVIWSEEPTDFVPLDVLGNQAIYGEMYCSKQRCDRVDDPFNDPDWEDTEFFGEDTKDKEEGDG